MIILTYQGLLSIIALSFVMLLMLKVALQVTEDGIAKTAFILLLIGLAALEWSTVYGNLRLSGLWPRLANVQLGLQYWMGPALYAYIQRITSRKNPFRQRLWPLHWLPGVAVELILIPYFFMSAEGRQQFAQTGIFGLLGPGVYVHTLSYIYFCQRPLREYQRQILENYSNIDEINLRWLQFFCYGFIAFMALDGFAYNFGIIGLALTRYLLGLVHVYVAILAYSALGPSRMRFAYALEQNLQQAKYHGSSLREDSAKFYLKRMNDLMTEEQLYLDSELSLNSLAEKLGINPRHLSQILNEQLKKNFYDYINEQRVEHAKRLLHQEGSGSVYDVAFESGYNNRSSFYNSFKRYVGMTPTAYRLKQPPGETA